MMALEGGVATIRHRGTGTRATTAWLAARGLQVRDDGWKVAIVLDDDEHEPTSYLHITIDANEWALRFARERDLSWIRVFDRPIVERDDFELLPRMPPLRDVALLIQHFEDRFHIRFRRTHANVHTTIPGAEDKIRVWVVASL